METRSIASLSLDECLALEGYEGWIPYFYETSRPTERTLVYMNGLGAYGAVELVDALIVHGRTDLVKFVRVHRRCTARERVDLWRRLATELGKPMLLLEEEPEGDDGYAIYPLYRVSAEGVVDFDRRKMTRIELTA